MTDRRASDEEGSDYHSERKNYPVIVRRVNGHVRWVVASASLGVLSAAGWSVHRVASDAAAALQLSTKNESAIALLQYQNAQTSEALRRIETKLDEQANALAFLTGAKKN